MSLDADRIVDRRRLKRRLTAWRIVAVVAIATTAAVAIGRDRVVPSRDHVARLVIEGLIVDDPWREDTLADVAEDESAKALLVRINSPGGTVAGSEALYRRLRAVAVVKPVVAVMAETATSGGYMTALGADRIIARAGSLTGSIGVILQTADVTRLLDKLGIKPEAVKSGPLKAQPNPMEPFADDARAAIAGTVLDLHDMFVDLVADRRGIDRMSARELADGRVFSGRQALAKGLVDAIGGEPEARAWLAESKGIPMSLPVTDVKIAREGWSWRDVVEDTVGKSVFSERLRLDGLVSVWHPSLR